MAKSKAQKQLEAKFRQVRGELIDAYRNIEERDDCNIIKSLLNNIDTLSPIESIVFQQAGILKQVDKIKKIKETFSTYPLELQIKAFNGWNIEGIEDLRLFRAEIEKKYILKQISSEDSLTKIKKRI